MSRANDIKPGQVYGYVTVVDYKGLNKRKQRVWKCKCVCGKFIEKTTTSLHKNKNISCGCMRHKDAKQQEMFFLTEDNYYSTEANMRYVSASQYKMFFNPYTDCCEAAALAEIKGEYKRPVTDSLLIGSYVDEALTGDLEKFKAEHPELISTRGESKGELKSTYRQAEVMIERAKRDPLFMSFVTGGIHQAIFTGEIEGVPVKIKIDHIAYKNGNPVALVDLKTVKSMYETFWVKDSGEHLSWVERWHYDLQGCIYQEIYRQNTGLTLPFYLAAISKDQTAGVAHPRLKVIQVMQKKLDERMAEVRRNIGKIQALKNGEIEPISCGKCDFCADTLPCEVISMDELMLEV